jgi:hypothetical protein
VMVSKVVRLCPLAELSYLVTNLRRVLTCYWARGYIVATTNGHIRDSVCRLFRFVLDPEGVEIIIARGRRAFVLKLVGKGGCPACSNGEWRASIPNSSHSNDSKIHALHHALHTSQLHRFTLHRVLIMIPFLEAA